MPSFGPVNKQPGLASSRTCFKQPKSTSDLKTVGMPLQVVELIICTILQVKYLYFEEELAIGSPKKEYIFTAQLV